MAIWVIKDGQREGPYDEQDVRELIYEGTYADEDLAIRDGQYHWSTLAEILGRRRPAYETAVSLMDPQSGSGEDLLAGEPMDDDTAAGTAPVPVRDEPIDYRNAPPARKQPPALPVAERETAPPAYPAPAATPGASDRTQAPAPVAIVDFQMPFTSMVIFMLKWALAAVPALMILGMIVLVFWLGIAMLLATLAQH